MNQSTTGAATPLEILHQGTARLGVRLDDNQQVALLGYLRLFEKWNRAYNLSAVRNFDDMVARHLLDSLSVLPHLGAGSEGAITENDEQSVPQSCTPQHCLPHNCLDVGSGGGLPGIPLAIAMPQTAFTLIDSNGKKARFLFQVKSELCLDNVTVVHARVEDFDPPSLFDAIISRAFAELSAMLESCRRLLARDGRLYAMKGRYPTAELAALPEDFILKRCHRLQVPGCDGERHLLVLAPASENNNDKHLANR